MGNDSIENGAVKPLLQQAEGTTQENLLQTALRHRWTILCTTILSLVAAFVYILQATPIYTSASRLYVEQTGPKIINESEGVMTRALNYLYTQGELIQSTPIVSDVVSDPQIKSLRTFTNVDNQVGYIKNNLKVVVGRRDDIITISFDSPYAAEAAQVVNSVVEAYIRYHSTSKRSTVLEVLRILQKEKVKRDKELSDKFAEILEFTRRNGVVSFDNKDGNIVFERLAALSIALTEAELATLNAKADFEAAQSLADEPAKIRQLAAASAQAGAQAIVGNRETELKSELNKAEVELKNAKYFCTEDHPSIRAMHTKIDHTKQELNEQAKDFAQAYVEVMQIKWIAAKQREDELQASFNGQLAAAREMGVKTTEYAVFQSELKRTERICEILDDRIKELNVTEDVGALNITTLEVARAATTPSRPQKGRIMAMAPPLVQRLAVVLPSSATGWTTDFDHLRRYRLCSGFRSSEWCPVCRKAGRL